MTVKRILNKLRRIPGKLQWYRLNRQAGITVARSAWIARSAQFSMKPDGIAYGGRITIGERVYICEGVILAPYGGSIDIGNDSYVGPYSVLYGHGGLTIKNKVMIGTHSIIIPCNHGFDDLDTPMWEQKVTKLGIVIEDDVWLGASVKVLDGVTIETGCVLGAGSVVTRSLPHHSIAAGVPARVLRKRGNLETD